MSFKRNEDELRVLKYRIDEVLVSLGASLLKR
nr:MAG TPA: hypothetical protein [Caudoviricetes sp.]